MEAIEPLHVQVLKRDFEEKRSKRRNYPLRTYAKDLGLSAAALSCLFNLKKGLSEKRARDIVRRLKLQGDEAELFLLSVIASHARTRSQKSMALKKMDQLLELRRQTFFVANDHVEAVRGWYYPAIFELSKLTSERRTPEWYAGRLRLTVPHTLEALQALVSLQLLKFENGEYRPAYQLMKVGGEAPARHLHLEMLKKANRDFETNSELPTTPFLDVTLAFAEDRLQEAREFIADFERRFVEKFQHEADVKNSVYHLSARFFRIDQTAN